MKKKINIAIVGLGRLGQSHALTLDNKIGNCQLVAACSIRAEELKWAEENLSVADCYKDFNEMLKHPNLDAICISSSTGMHPEHIMLALKANINVFCEKPLSLNLEDGQKVIDVAKQHPDKVCMMGFVRRFDKSYAKVKEKIDNGSLGKSFYYYLHTGDAEATAGFQVDFATTSGGFLLDANLHDFDLLHWLSGQEVVKVVSQGGAYCYPEFAKHNDADNILTMCELADNTMALISGTRTSFHGHSTEASVRGTKGEVAVSRVPSSDYVEDYTVNGITRACVQTFYDRFKDAFLIELQAFINHVQNGTKPEITLEDAQKATKVALAAKESFITKKPVYL